MASTSDMSTTKKPKMARLPKDAKITKRPLMRPPLASPYAGAQSQKIVYVSTKTPFISAVKRVEKLLRLSDKRLVQSATTLAQDKQYRKRRRGGDGDDIEAIVQAAEELKRNGKRRKTGAEEESAAGEEIVLKGTGKAIARVMELGVWFQQRAEDYAVRIATGTVSSIDDVEYERVEGKEDAEAGAERDEMDVDGEAAEGGVPLKRTFVSEARIRKVNVLEVHVSLR